MYIYMQSHYINLLNWIILIDISWTCSSAFKPYRNSQSSTYHIKKRKRLFDACDQHIKYFFSQLSASHHTLTYRQHFQSQCLLHFIKCLFMWRLKLNSGSVFFNPRLQRTMYRNVCFSVSLLHHKWLQLRLAGFCWLGHLKQRTRLWNH